MTSIIPPKLFSMSGSTSKTAVYNGIKTAEGLEFLTSEPIAVVVGEGPTKTWHLPKGLLTNASPFFAGALNGSFAEATSISVNLPEDDTNAFTLFVRWLYVDEITGKLFGSTDQDPILGMSSGTKHAKASLDSSTRICLQACILGDKLGCPVFHDLAMIEVLRCHYAEAITPETMRVVFEHSAAGSELRQFAIDELRLDISHGLCHNAASYVSVAKNLEDFGLDFLKACMETSAREPINPGTNRGRYMEVVSITEKQ